VADDFAQLIRAALRSAPPQPLDPDTVYSCINSGNPAALLAETQFRQAFTHGLTSLPPSERAPGLNGVTGHIAESVVETMLVDIGWVPLEHFAGPFSGGHGIDRAMSTPDLANVYAIEVKGTLAARRWPRLRAGDIPQLSGEWLGKPDNPGMESLGLEPAGLAILAILVHFGRRQWRAVRGLDLRAIEPVESLEDFAP
jgi:hypothetical protein